MKKIYRVRSERKIGGVCAGIGELTDIDPTIIRLATVVLALMTGFFPFFIGYLAAWWIIPEKERTVQAG